MSKGEAKRKAAACEAPLGFEPRISCLQDRRFDQLSHGAPSLRRVSPGQLSSAAAEGWFASQPAHCTPVCVLFSERKATLPKEGEAKRKAAACEAPLGFEPRISCLQDRRFDQLSHGAPSLQRVSPGQLSSAAAEGWFASQPAHCTPVCVLFSERKATLPKEVPELPQRHRWDSNPGSPVY
ncbi:hypothetical protein Q8A67_018602 [Cirrhinus molitorella]|uniref:Uncharacterized protein n=1 Tax=Cirrhinus molitorella TaxID=172907 RepID=A0AA88PHZ7_9TELE|nr:hypothetical protein Q8A67_018602 [Cirrhinus molitorella]